MIFGSVCSGIEAASVAWAPLGWRASFYSEIEPFPRAVLKYRHPETPLHGDFTTIQAGEYKPIDLLVGGTPCQSFSVAGLRGGLDDDRGNLALEYLRLADRLRPRWLVWENVPGVLSSNSGRDFGAILGGMVELGYGVAYRVLDAQFFGLAQRRRRVFVVGHLGDWRRAAAVLFERNGLSGHPAPRREAGQRTAGTLAPGAHPGGFNGRDAERDLLIAHTLKGEGFDASEDGTGRGTPIVPVCFSSKDYGADAEADLSPTLRAGGHDGSHANAGVPPAIAYGLRSDASRTGEAKRPSIDAVGRARLRDAGFNPLEECAPTLDAGAAHAVAFALRGREGGAMPEMGGDKVGSLRAASGGSSRDYVAFQTRGSNLDVGDISGTIGSNSDRASGSAPMVARTAETMYGVSHANASQTGPYQALRALLEAAGEEAFAEWGLGVLAAFWPAEILRSEVHGRRVRRASLPERGLVNVALSRSQNGAAWTVRDLWQAGCDGCPPQGWGPHEQLGGQLGAYLSELPYSPSPAQRLLHDLWGASEGAGLLREALSAVQEARRSVVGEGQPASSGSAVRRLTVEECEALQGFPRSYTLIPWRKGMAPDGPRYKALGNSMAVPVMRWIGERIEAVERLLANT